MRAARRLQWFQLVLSLVLTGGMTPTLVEGQDLGPGPASTILPSDHWSVPIARRLAALGLADSNFGWGDGSLTAAAVGRIIHDAAALTRERAPELAPVVTGYWTRFAREFSATAASIDSGSSRSRGSRHVPRMEGRLSFGYSSATGRVLPVRSLDKSRENITGPFAYQDLSEFVARGSVKISLGSHLAASLSPERSGGAWKIQEGYALATLGSLAFWGGRRAPDFSTGAGGGIVFRGTAPFTGGGLLLVQPMRLPWLLRHLGAIRFESFLSRIDSNATVPKPWVLGSHGSISPHPRLLLGATQAFMFGGVGVAPFTWRNFKEMFRSHGINAAGSEFENGLASVELRFRPPLPVVPLSLYLEWGADDNHAAWTLFPGIVSGAHVSAIPGIPALSLGLERTHFAGPCRPYEENCHREYYATWYRHYLFKDGWTLDRQPIGHPLGGEGTEWLLYGSWDDPAVRLRLDGRAFLRQRGPYNIYSPDREGWSVGGIISSTYRVTPSADLLLTGSLERGRSDWQESALFAGMRWSF